jgi:hypothetical protein
VRPSDFVVADGDPAGSGFDVDAQRRALEALD